MNFGLAHGGINPFTGIPVITSEACPILKEVPARQHRRKRWMTERYHQRIQKKWDKRFGIITQAAFYMTHEGILCHPVNKDKLVEAIKNQQIIGGV